MATLDLVPRAQRIIDLGPHLNNHGIARQADAGPGGLDGFGTAFAGPTLPRPGASVVRNGVGFLFAGDGGPRGDNLACEGQRITFAPSRCTALHVLGMCDWRGFAEVLVLVYEDGIPAREVLGLSDGSCFRGRLFGEQEGLIGRLVARDSLVPHAVLFGIPIPEEGYQMHEMSIAGTIWHQVVPVQPSRVLVGCELPDNPAMHLFALTLEERR